jgi:hypothetical protein
MRVMRWRRLWFPVLFLALISRAGADTIDDLVAEISEDQLRAHLTALPAPRDTVAAQAAAANYIVSELQSFGYTVEQDPVLQSANLIVHIPGERYPERTFVVGAHFDSDEGCPGADDNGAAVAGILEMARVLAGQHLATSLDVVAFAAEEVFGRNLLPAPRLIPLDHLGLVPPRSPCAGSWFGCEVIEVGDEFRDGLFRDVIHIRHFFWLSRKHLALFRLSVGVLFCCCVIILSRHLFSPVYSISLIFP